MLTCWWRVAGPERVPNQARLTTAISPVTLHRALGPQSTDPGARIPTLVADAGQVGRAVGVDGALRLALHVGVAKHFRQAGTGGGSVPFSAFGVDATRRGSTRVNDLRSWCGS